jgi:hypothetical protein
MTFNFVRCLSFASTTVGASIEPIAREIPAANRRRLEKSGASVALLVSTIHRSKLPIEATQAFSHRCHCRSRFRRIAARNNHFRTAIERRPRPGDEIHSRPTGDVRTSASMPSAVVTRRSSGCAATLTHAPRLRQARRGHKLFGGLHPQRRAGSPWLGR